MAIPTEKSIEIPLLKVVAEAGGQLKAADAIRLVKVLFPELSEADGNQQTKTGAKQWSNRVRWTRQYLINSGYLHDESATGIWEITAKGRAHLAANITGWKAAYSAPVVKEPTAQEEKASAITVPEVSLHDRLQQCWVEIGQMLDRYPEKDYWSSPYTYDVIWRSFLDAPRASHVFAIQSRGNLIEGLAKLQHASDIWGSKLFLMVVGEKYNKPPKFVGELLSGTFHRLSKSLIILSPEVIEEFHAALKKQAGLLKHLIMQ